MKLVVVLFLAAATFSTFQSKAGWCGPNTPPVGWLRTPPATSNTSYDSGTSANGGGKGVVAGTPSAFNAMLEAAKQKNPNGLIMLYFCDELTFSSVGEGGTTVIALRKKNPKIKLTIFDNPVVVAAIAKAGIVPVKVALTKDNLELIKKFNAVDSTVALVSLTGKPLAGLMGEDVTQSKLIALLTRVPDLQKIADK